MDVEQLFQSTLKALPCPVSKPPAGGDHESYVAFNEVYGGYQRFASNLPRRLRHMVQVQAFSKKDDGTHRVLFFLALELLRAAGVKVYAYGPDDYETTTKYHYIAATCIWIETLTN